MSVGKTEGQEVPFCAQETRLAGEPLLGTATLVKVWLLLEYSGPWPAKATQENGLPAAVQTYLAEQAAAISDSRLLFIKQRQKARYKIRLFVVRTDEVAPVIVGFELAAYEDLLALDIAAAAGGEEVPGGIVRDEPLFLVCTNGMRDRCCAKFGLPVYRALRKEQPEAAWQSTHIGGHRFAPTALFLPHSVNYGFLEPGEAQSAVDAHLRGELYNLGRCRGRTYYTPVVQAADVYLRRELNLFALTGLRLRSAGQGEADQWRVQFDVAEKGTRYEVLLRQWMTEDSYLVSCSSPAKKPVARYELQQITALPK